MSASLIAAVWLLKSTQQGYALFDDERRSQLYCGSTTDVAIAQPPTLVAALGSSVACLPRRSDYAAPGAPLLRAPEALCLLLRRLQLPGDLAQAVPGGRSCA